jgi:two-component system NtrC family sensor kinase
MSGHDLVLFLSIRRQERNIMLYKKRLFFEEFSKSIGSTFLGQYPGLENYRMLVAKLFQLIEEENQSVERMRLSARKIQSFTENLSREERMDIATTIKVSSNLLLIALFLILIFGTIVNIKLATSIATPIRTLEKISKKIAEGDFSESIEVKGKDELASLETAFNQMEERLKNALLSLELTIERLQEKQSQLVEAEKLASIGKLAAGIAHEINNPLTSVLTFSNLMLEQCPPSDPRHEKLKLMARETNRARTIVRQLLNFGRETVITPEKININRSVAEVADSLAAQDAFKGIGLDLKLDDKLPLTLADPAQLSQVIMNILLNAIHAVTPPGKIEVATRQNGESIEIAISDTGAGIPEEHIHRIFDPFFTTKDASKGTGLGLAVSYGIVKKHGGDIEVTSTVGAGTTFTVRLPLISQVEANS